MTSLKLCTPQSKPLQPCDGSWDSLAYWFLRFVTCLDKGDLRGAAECQTELEKHGFKIKYSRLPQKGQ